MLEWKSVRRRLRALFGRGQHKRLEASVGPQSHFVAIKNPTTSADAIRIQDDRGPSVEADAHGAEIWFKTKGPPRQNEVGTLDCCRVLADYLRRDDPAVSEPRLPPGLERGVDAEILTSSGLLSIQVTRPNVGALWHTLSRANEVSDKRDSKQLVEELLSAARKKAARLAPTGIVLALNAMDTAIHVMGPVRHQLLAHRSDFAMLGFEAVWLVGPVPELVVRLDRDINPQ